MKSIAKIIIIFMPIFAYANGGGGFVGKNKFGVYFNIDLQDCEFSDKSNFYQCNFKRITVQDSSHEDLTVSVNCYLQNPRYVEFTEIDCKPMTSANQADLSSVKHAAGGDPYSVLTSIRYEIDRSLMKKENTEEFILSCKTGCNDYVPQTFSLWQPED